MASRNHFMAEMDTAILADSTNRLNRAQDLGVGLPFDGVERRDLTVKPSRRAAPAPPVEPPVSTRAEYTSTERPIITTSIVHAPIPPPSYHVRSQPVNLARSASFSELGVSPTISGGLTRRLSVSSSSGAEDDDEDAGDTVKPAKALARRPSKRRSDNLPVFPPPDTNQNQAAAHLNQELAELPPNPRLWLPSHLSLYLSAHLQLHPLIAADVIAFIRASRLSGRTFLRMRDGDFEELGINVVWRTALSEARDTLQREASGGRVMWGYEGTRHDDGVVQGEAVVYQPPVLKRRGSMEVEGSDLEEEEGKEEWKRSWRRMQGRSHVRGIVGRFNSPIVEGSCEGTPDTSPIKQHSKRSRAYPLSPYPPSTVHGRTESESSSPSVASRAEVDDDRTLHDVFGQRYDAFDKLRAASESSPASIRDSLLPPPELVKSYFSPDSHASTSSVFATSTEEPHTPESAYQSKIMAHSRPYGLVRRPSQQARDALNHKLARSAAVDHNDESESEDAGLGGPTLKPDSAPRDDKRAGLGELFGLDVPSTRTDGAENAQNDLMEIEVGARGGKRGSMVLVKRSQLEALTKRMAEVETQVAAAQGVESASPSEFGERGVEELDQRLANIEALLPLRHSSTRCSSPQHHDIALPRHSHSEVLSSWMQHSLSSFSLSDIATHSHDSARQLMDREGPLMSWTALGGYCIAASIGIGIVVGEVVAARLFDFRRR